MAENTPNLGLLKKDPLADGNETFNIETMLNDNWDKIDEAVGQVREELANVNVDIPDASLREKGIVQLSNATNGTREDVAATEKAVKAAYDEALAGKQLGVEQKANVVAALNSIGVVASTSETWSQLVAKMAGVIRATGNATAADLLSGRTASNASGPITGTMPNRGAVSQTITTQNGSYTVPAGYHNGSGVIRAAFANLIASNIRAGVNVGGVVGNLQAINYGTVNLSYAPAQWSPPIGVVYNTVVTLPANLNMISFISEMIDDSAVPGTKIPDSYLTKNYSNNYIGIALIDSNNVVWRLAEPVGSQFYWYISSVFISRQAGTASVLHLFKSLPSGQVQNRSVTTSQMPSGFSFNGNVRLVVYTDLTNLDYNFRANARLTGRLIHV